MAKPKGSFGIKLHLDQASYDDVRKKLDQLVDEVSDQFGSHVIFDPKKLKSGIGEVLEDVKKIKIAFEDNDVVIDKMNSGFDKLRKNVKNTTDEAEKLRQVIKTVSIENAEGEKIKEITTYYDGLGKIYEEIESINKKTGEFEVSSTREVTNKNAQLQQMFNTHKQLLTVLQAQKNAEGQTGDELYKQEQILRASLSAQEHWADQNNLSAVYLDKYGDELDKIVRTLGAKDAKLVDKDDAKILGEIEQRLKNINKLKTARAGTDVETGKIYTGEIADEKKQIKSLRKSLGTFDARIEAVELVEKYTEIYDRKIKIEKSEAKTVKHQESQNSLIDRAEEKLERIKALKLAQLKADKETSAVYDDLIAKTERQYKALYANVDASGRKDLSKYKGEITGEIDEAVLIDKNKQADTRKAEALREAEKSLARLHRLELESLKANEQELLVLEDRIAIEENYYRAKLKESGKNPLTSGLYEQQKLYDYDSYQELGKMLDTENAKRYSSLMKDAEASQKKILDYRLKADQADDGSETEKLYNRLRAFEEDRYNKKIKVLATTQEEADALAEIADSYKKQFTEISKIYTAKQNDKAEQDAYKEAESALKRIYKLQTQKIGKTQEEQDAIQKVSDIEEDRYNKSYKQLNSNAQTSLTELELLLLAEQDVALATADVNEKHKEQVHTFKNLKDALKEQYDAKIKLLNAEEELKNVYAQSEANAGKYVSSNKGNLTDSSLKAELDVLEDQLKKKLEIATATKNNNDAEAEAKSIYNEAKTHLANIEKYKTQGLRASIEGKAILEQQIVLEKEKYNLALKNLNSDENETINQATQNTYQQEYIKLLKKEHQVRDENIKLAEDLGSAKGDKEQFTLGNIAKWSLWRDLIQEVSMLLRNGLKFVNDYNSALTEISIVTGENQAYVRGLGVEYNKLAKEMSVSSLEIAQASVEFYRQGLAQEEVMERMKQTTMFAKISNLEFTQSAEVLTATVNSMNVSIEKATDVFSFLGD